MSIPSSIVVGRPVKVIAPNLKTLSTHSWNRRPYKARHCITLYWNNNASPQTHNPKNNTLFGQPIIILIMVTFSTRLLSLLQFFCILTTSTSAYLFDGYKAVTKIFVLILHYLMHQFSVWSSWHIQASKNWLIENPLLCCLTLMAYFIWIKKKKVLDIRYKPSIYSFNTVKCKNTLKSHWLLEKYPLDSFSCNRTFRPISSLLGGLIHKLPT